MLQNPNNTNPSDAVQDHVTSAVGRVQELVSQFKSEYKFKLTDRRAFEDWILQVLTELGTLVFEASEATDCDVCFRWLSTVYHLSHIGKPLYDLLVQHLKWQPSTAKGNDQFSVVVSEFLGVMLKLAEHLFAAISFVVSNETAAGDSSQEESLFNTLLQRKKKERCCPFVLFLSGTWALTSECLTRNKEIKTKFPQQSELVAFLDDFAPTLQSLTTSVLDAVTQLTARASSTATFDEDMGFLCTHLLHPLPSDIARLNLLLKAVVRCLVTRPVQTIQHFDCAQFFTNAQMYIMPWIDALKQCLDGTNQGSGTIAKSVKLIQFFYSHVFSLLRKHGEHIILDSRCCERLVKLHNMLVELVTRSLPDAATESQHAAKTTINSPLMTTIDALCGYIVQSDPSLSSFSSFITPSYTSLYAYSSVLKNFELLPVEIQMAFFDHEKNSANAVTFNGLLDSMEMNYALMEIVDVGSDDNGSATAYSLLLSSAAIVPQLIHHEAFSSFEHGLFSALLKRTHPTTQLFLLDLLMVYSCCLHVDIVENWARVMLELSRSSTDLPHVIKCALVIICRTVAKRDPPRLLNLVENTHPVPRLSSTVNTSTDMDIDHDLDMEFESWVKCWRTLGLLITPDTFEPNALGAPLMIVSDEYRTRAVDILNIAAQNLCHSLKFIAELCPKTDPNDVEVILNATSMIASAAQALACRATKLQELVSTIQQILDISYNIVSQDLKLLMHVDIRELMNLMLVWCCRDFMPMEAGLSILEKWLQKMKKTKTASNKVISLSTATRLLHNLSFRHLTVSERNSLTSILSYLSSSLNSETWLSPEELIYSIINFAKHTPHNEIINDISSQSSRNISDAAQRVIGITQTSDLSANRGLLNKILDGGGWAAWVSEPDLKEQGLKEYCQMMKTSNQVAGEMSDELKQSLLEQGPSESFENDTQMSEEQAIQMAKWVKYWVQNANVDRSKNNEITAALRELATIINKQWSKH